MSHHAPREVHTNNNMYSQAASMVPFQSLLLLIYIVLGTSVEGTELGGSARGACVNREGIDVSRRLLWQGGNDSIFKNTKLL